MANSLRKKVDSSTISEVEYFPDQQELHIHFINKSKYTYSNVPFKVYMGILNAPSAGSYLWKNIRDKYPTKKIK